MAPAKKRGRPKGWRKPDAKRAFLLLRMTPEHMRRLTVIARRARVSRGELVRQWIAGYVAETKKEG